MATRTRMSNTSGCKKTTIGNGAHSRPSKNKGTKKKKYRGQGR